MKNISSLLLAIFIVSCGQVDSSQNGSQGADTGQTLNGECVQRDGMIIICGLVVAPDGVTPIVAAEIEIVIDGVEYSLADANKDNAVNDDMSRCLTSFQGRYSCIVPMGIYGWQIISIKRTGFSGNYQVYISNT